MNRKTMFGQAVAFLLLLGAGAALAAPVIFSSGFTFPFTISQAPQGFGTYGGSFFIPDTGTGEIKVVPPGGLPPNGTPTVFQHVEGLIRGGVFLPPDFGAVGGQFAQLSAIANPTDPGGPGVGRITTFDATGKATILATGPNDPVTLFDPAIAPQGFGPYGGQLFLTSQFGDGSVLRVDQQGNITPFAIRPQVQFPGVAGPVSIGATGIVFAPPGFGSVGGMLLINDVDFSTLTAYIIALDPQGNASPFAAVPLGPGEFAPRQMAFAPADFGQYAGMMFLSIASSNDNSGRFGAVDVIDQAGHDIATLVQGSDVDAFNPRGLLFLPGGQLLISDATPDPIYLATPGDFRSLQAPEPGSGLLLCAGLAALLSGLRRRG